MIARVIDQTVSNTGKVINPLGSEACSIVYIHGFNSSPASAKARLIHDYFYRYQLAEQGGKLFIPELSYDPELAMQALEGLIEPGVKTCLVGSSLGGYYATWLAEKYSLQAVLVNPAVAPAESLGAEFLGPQKNYYTGEEYELTMDHVIKLQHFDTASLRNPLKYYLLVETGDEVLDYRLATAKYAGAKQKIYQGGNHGFEHFEQEIPDIFLFAGFAI